MFIHIIILVYLNAKKSSHNLNKLLESAVNGRTRGSALVEVNSSESTLADSFRGELEFL
jgi:transposase